MSILESTGRFRGDEVINNQREHLEPQELLALFNTLQAGDPFWFAYFRLQYYFGCRVSEVALVMREDVEWSQQRILIRRLKTKQFQSVDDDGKAISRKAAKSTGAAGKRKISDGFSQHVYQLPDTLMPLLRGVRDAGDQANPWLFQSARRSRAMPVNRMGAIRVLEGGWRAVSRSAADARFRQAARAAGVPLLLTHSHVLRHTRATLLLADGMEEKDVQLLLGHSDLKTTRRYIGVAKSLRLRANTMASLGMGDLA